MTEVFTPVALARLELARLSQTAKEELHAILGAAAAEAGVLREHLGAVTGKLHEVLSVEVAPLDHLARIKTLEDSLSDAVQGKAALEARINTLLENNEAAGREIAGLRESLTSASQAGADSAAMLAEANQKIAALQAQLDEAHAALPEPPAAAPAPEAPQA
jgi:chromosome segregation ATPase